MEYSHRSRSNAVCFTDLQRNIYLNDDSYDKDLYQFEKDQVNQSFPNSGSTCNTYLKKSNQFHVGIEENTLSSNCYLNDVLESDSNQNLHSKHSFETSQHLSIDNLRTVEELKSITDIFYKQLNLQEGKGVSESHISTAKLIHH